VTNDFPHYNDAIIGRAHARLRRMSVKHRCGLSTRLLFLSILFAVMMTFAVTMTSAQQTGVTKAAPEMKRLITAFAGSYTTVERHHAHDEFPSGGIRTGRLVIRPSAGGNVMITELHSHSLQGDLNFMSAYWWDPSSKVYRLIMCAKENPEGCFTGAIAQWEGNKLIKSWETEENGKKTRFRDTIEFKPNSFVNVAEISIDGAPFQEIIRTTATRKTTR
jgi:hypothetical protein